MAKLTPRQIAEKQVKRVQQSTGDYRDGINAVTESPMAKAAAKKDKYLAGVQAAVDSGAYEDGLNSVSLDEWKRAAADKGATRLADGVAKAIDKITDFQTQFAPVRDAVKAQVDAMPNNTFEERLERQRANAIGLHAFKYRRRRAR